MWKILSEKLAVTRRQYLLYAALYLTGGLAMNLTGKLLAIAEFAHWWQVITCYLLYLVPASLLVRDRPFFEQYAFGLVVLAPLELLGYALGTSIAHEGNVIDQILGERNFTLAMTTFFALILPVGNAAVARLEEVFWGRE